MSNVTSIILTRVLKSSKYRPVLNLFRGLWRMKQLLIIIMIAFAGLIAWWQSDVQTQPRAGDLFYYYDLERRIDSLDTLEKALDSKYALLHIKESRLGLNKAKLFENARKLEAKFPNVDSTFFQAVSNLWYLDRLRLLMASFRDTHLKVQPMMKLPVIDLGIRIKSVADGGYIVSEIDEVLRAQLDEVGLDLSVGSEVFMIGDTPIHEEAERLAQYISSSSPEYALQMGLAASTSRSFVYPKSPFSPLTYRTRSGRIQAVELEWTYSYTYKRTDAIFYLDYLGFDFLWRDFKPDPAIDKITSHLSGMKEWYGHKDPSSLVQRSGIVAIDGKESGLLQIFSFHEESLLSAETGESLKWDLAIARFLKELEAKKLPLILDLRDHQGGIVEHPVRLMSLIARNNESYPTYVEGFRLTPSIHQMWQRVGRRDLFDHEDKIIASKIRTALRRGQEYSGVWNKGDAIGPSDDFGGFDQEVVALISEKCISACDILAILLESSGRATLIGSPSNGTGAGYFDWDPYDSSTYTDLYDIFKIDIPNLLFGHSIEGGPDYLFGAKSTFSLNRENRPVNPHIYYRTSRNDIDNGDISWLSLALGNM